MGSMFFVSALDVCPKWTGNIRIYGPTIDLYGQFMGCPFGPDMENEVKKTPAPILAAYVVPSWKTQMGSLDWLPKGPIWAIQGMLI